MHDTLNPNIKAYLDELQIKEGKLHLRGWAFHSYLSVIPLRVSGSSTQILCEIHSRDDVAKHYQRIDAILCGWNCIYPIIETVWLEVLIDEEWQPLIKLSNDIESSVRTVDRSFVVVDNFYSNPDSVRNFALKCQFNAHPNAHKGKRTDITYLFPSLKESFENILGKRIKNWHHYGTNGCFQYCIGGDQLVYHYDGQTYAGLIYLTPDAPPEAGTSFYRSKITKKMKVNNGEHDIVFKNGFLDPSQFDLVDTVGNIYNRLILFDAKYIHAATSYFGNNEHNSRLFQLFFFDFEE
jgi:hypothetical protein